ncbi:MAG TPA: Gfo/Idh/MocA family oxidoreductase [Casimicrobiaceae bacterium]|nr:Gfo/Idh/MocA family oxidoreductase [Casimicrobiaceae bacterium]
MRLKFAAIGLDHRHIYDQVQSLVDAGAQCVGYWTDGTPKTLDGFVKRFPELPRVDDRRRLLDDPSIRLITCAAIPCDRAMHAVEAMRAGKDFMVDKPGVTTFDQLDEVRGVQQHAGRIWTVNFTERFEVRAVTRALELVRAGAIGDVVQTVGLGPHRLNRGLRDPWFFDRGKYGGILVDIASHQIDQFLAFTGASDAEIVLARTSNIAHAGDPDFEDFGEIVMTTGDANAYIRVDWFTPDGLPTWGDGRLFITGTRGSIELRKYVDIAGRAGKDHLFLVDAKDARYVDCGDAGLPYYDNLLRDIEARTETSMSQAHCYRVCELALRAQTIAAKAGRTR